MWAERTKIIGQKSKVEICLKFHDSPWVVEFQRRSASSVVRANPKKVEAKCHGQSNEAQVSLDQRAKSLLSDEEFS